MDAELIAEAPLADPGPVIRQSLQPGIVSSSPAGRSPTPLLVLGRLIESQSVYCIVDSTACDTFLGKVLYNVVRPQLISFLNELLQYLFSINRRLKININRVM